MKGIAAFFFLSLVPLIAQQRVSPGLNYHRVYAITPLLGSGTPTDPKRPLFVSPQAPLDRAGVLGYQMQISDDGRLALVEFVFRDPAAFQNVLAIEAAARGIAVTPALQVALPGQPSGLQTALQAAVPGLIMFERGKAAESTILAAFLKYKANFKFRAGSVRPQ